MALIIADMVQETTTTTGYGDLTLAGAVDGFQTFNSAMATGDTCDYHIIDGVNEERGLGTFTDPNLLARTTVYGSTNSGSKISLASGSKTVFITLPATRIQQLIAAIGTDETSITSTATLAVGSRNVCSGTTSDYLVYMPTAVGNTGATIDVRADSSCTKTITVDGNASETVGNRLTLPLHANDYVRFKSDGSNWFLQIDNRSNLVAEYTVSGSAINTFTLSGLDILADGGVYKIVGSIITNGTVSHTDVQLFINGDTTQAHYVNVYNVVVGSGSDYGAGTYTGGISNSSPVTELNTGLVSSFIADIGIGADSKAFYDCVDNRNQNGYLSKTVRNTVTKIDATVSNITSLTFTGASSDIAAGSKVSIFRVK